MNKTEPVKLTVYFTDLIPMGSESLWATPIEGTEGGGTYELINVSMYCALVPGDVVRAQLNHLSRLQIIGVESFAPRVVSLMHFDLDPAGVSPSREVLGHASVRIARRLEAQGAHVEGPPGTLTCSWPLNMGEKQVRQRTSKAQAKERGWSLASVWPLDVRREIVDEAMDTQLRGDEKAAAETNYWVADDPRWAELGVDDPAVLARIQTLVAERPSVLSTIEAGLHENILTYMARLDAPNPHDLPPLDGPLLVSSDEEDPS